MTAPLPCGPTPDDARVARDGFEGGESGFQYGHVIEGEWRWEPRGERYASSRRSWWMGPPEPIARGFGPVTAAHGDPARVALRRPDAETRDHTEETT